jgi:hypothetical protein
MEQGTGTPDNVWTGKFGQTVITGLVPGDTYTANLWFNNSGPSGHILVSPYVKYPAFIRAIGL